METEEQRRARLQQAYQAYSGVPYADPAAGMSVDPAMSAPPPDPEPMVPLANDPQAAAYAAAQQPAPAGPPASMAGGGNGASGSWAPEPNGASGSWEPAPPGANMPISPDLQPTAPASMTQQMAGQAPQQQPAGQRGPARPTLYDEQTAMAGASRDAADQARIDADIGVDMQAGYTELLGEQKAEQAAQAANLVRSQQAELERIGKETEDRRRVRQAVVSDLEKQYSTLNDRAAQVEIRDRRSTGRKVMGALAIGLGQMTDHNNLVAGLMQGMNVQTNNAEQISGMINASIERDLEMQRANLANDRASAAAKFSELGVAQDAVKDVDSQQMLAKAAIADKYALSLEGLSKQGLSEQVTTVAAQEAARLRTESASAKASILEQQATRDEDRMWALQVQREQERKAAAAAKAAGKGTSPMVADLIAKEQAGKITAAEMDTLNKLRKGAKDAAPDAEAAGLEAPKGRTIANGALAKQASKEERSKFNETQNVTQMLESKIDRLLQLRSQNPVAVGAWGTDAYKEAQTLNKAIMLGLKKKEELGTLDNQSERFLNEMTGDPNAWFINTPETQLNVVKEAARHDLESRAQNIGYSSALDDKEAYVAKYGARPR